MYDNFKTTGGKKLLAYFKESIFVTVVGFICAYIWAEHMHPGSGFLALFIVLFLSILEVTLICRMSGGIGFLHGVLR